MLCWQDRTFCSNDTCARYQMCENSLFVAKKEKDEAVTDPARELPIFFRKLICEEYERK